MKEEEGDLRGPYDFGYEDGVNGKEEFASFPRSGKTGLAIREYREGYSDGLKRFQQKRAETITVSEKR